MFRLGYDDHEAFFRTSSVPISHISTSTVKCVSHSKEALRLPYLEVKGNPVHVLDLVAEQTDAGDYRGACKLMYDLLLSNSPVLDIDPATLPQLSDGSHRAKQASEVCHLSCMTIMFHLVLCFT